MKKILTYYKNISIRRGDFIIFSSSIDVTLIDLELVILCHILKGFCLQFFIFFKEVFFVLTITFLYLL